MPVRLAADLELPDNAVTQTFAFLARKGAGKSYSCGKMVEGLLDLGAPVIVLDPVGTWYGLRLGTNGKSKGYDIPVFGGEHGDIPLEPEQGELLGELLIDRHLAAVVDVSGFRKNERKRFVTDFAESLFHHAKRSRSPRMLVLEEAQLFAPQRAQGEERMLGAIEDIVRLGRNYGIGSTMISQRPQSINKEVLNQVECLFVGQLNAAHERKAVEEWVAEHKAEKDWTKQLPSLPVGTMIVWSPQWLGVMQRVKIGKKKTFDASATPELGTKSVTVQPLHATDVDALRQALAPKPKASKSTVVNPHPNRPAENSAQVEELVAQLEATRAAFNRERFEVGRTLAVAASELGQIAEGIVAMCERLKAHPALQPGSSSNEVKLAHVVPTKPSREPVQPPSGDAKGLGLKSGAVRMIELLAAFYPGNMTKAQVAKAAGMTVSGGTFTAYWSTLNKVGFLQRVGQDAYVASERALRFLGKDRQQVPSNMGGRVAFWEERLKAGEVNMLRAIVADPQGITRAALAESVSMTMTGGTFTAYLGTLVRNRLVAKDGDLLKAHPWLKGEE